ncbi:hypothetical protein [Streptomyces hesseae]|uniref:Resolvase/invertase-type recombinase catalytic domain-containing protein n=1 Tax=Streptomyces hesseae TaxID=3075519 RepID=A0ABU2SSH4_9ACTN|nr:hypothetical protein [Streptomyces sp. DSM 40473]MDT0451881.1 hypothetical protein [Streptomyces sp. DSM 40473]
MVSNQRAERQQHPPSARRTEGDRQRRRTLADTAAGLTAKVKRFRCVIYLSGVEGVDVDLHRQGCQETAEVLGWDVAAVIVENDRRAVPPWEREGLTSALGLLRRGEAGAILTAWRSMISPSIDEYKRTLREIDEDGGFVYAKRLTGPGETNGATP